NSETFSDPESVFDAPSKRLRKESRWSRGASETAATAAVSTSSEPSTSTTTASTLRPLSALPSDSNNPEIDDEAQEIHLRTPEPSPSLYAELHEFEEYYALGFASPTRGNEDPWGSDTQTFKF
ncbi:hypothetical protein H0H92_000581, partial [Tricholoma furcatifolium]